MSAAKAEAPKLDGRLLAALTVLRIARDGLAQERRDRNHRRDLSLEWMREKPTRTLSEAMAYVGMESVNDEIKSRKRVLRESIDALLSLGVDLEARRAE